MSQTPFRLEAGQLQRLIAEPETYEAEHIFSDIRVIETRIDEQTPVRLSCRLSSLHDGVMVSAELTARWTAACRRCSKAISEEVRWEVSEFFTPDPVEGETYPLGEETLDLMAMVHDQLLLQLPLAPACSEECKGLCTKCGVNLNESSCDCETEKSDPRWEILSELEFDE